MSRPYAMARVSYAPHATVDSTWSYKHDCWVTMVLCHPDLAGTEVGQWATHSETWEDAQAAHSAMMERVRSFLTSRA